MVLPVLGFHVVLVLQGLLDLLDLLDLLGLLGLLGLLLVSHFQRGLVYNKDLLLVGLHLVVLHLVVLLLVVFSRT
jgi:hypothetical protein